jgi:glyoxylase-like metal-dependent hydrolase (beta-lactamase superfamily II)
VIVFEQLRVGGDRNFGYLLGDSDSGEAALIDPSYAPGMLVERARAQRLTPKFIINTHGHPDHVNGNAEAVQLTGAPVAAHPQCATRVDVPLGDPSELRIGALRLQFVHVPGHAVDHILVYESTHKLLITGDLLFVGKVGGTRSDDDARTEWASLQRLLTTIPADATVWPGHDYGARPSSTVALEAATNPFLRCADADAFIRFKAGWAEYKAVHGLR